MRCNGGSMIPEKSKKHRVLIVDDSSFMRMAIRSILNRDPEIEIFGTAINGAEGVAKALALKPDIITMDVEMPVMDGITALKEIMSSSPTQVIMVSTLTKEGATATFSQGIMVAIHMQKAFTGHFSDRLNSKCALQVKEAADVDLLLPGRVLVAPAGRHITLQRKGGGIVVQAVPVENFPRYVYVPSIDLMMTSLSDACKGPMVGVILTGMGNDGLSGMRHIKEKGGMTHCFRTRRHRLFTACPRPT